MKIKNFVKISAFAILAFSMLGCGKEETKENESKSEILEEKIEEKEITVAGIEMVKIPDSAEHKGLYFGKYEVTQEQWQEIMGNNRSIHEGYLSRPVEQVSWNDCQKFIKKLNARTEVKSAGITFRLPTEEEWEYACRAGSTGKYGLLADGREGTLDEMGWYEDNSDDKTHPVGQKKPNAWGLYDMHGNVWEWTASANGSSRIIRGGGYYNDASYCESVLSYWFDPDCRSYYFGFRLVALNKVEAERIAREEAERKARKKAESLIKDMVRIPDSAEHKGLYFGKYEVTQEQWQAVMGNNPSSFKGDLSRPVECVSWYDCQEFIKKLNALPEVKQSGLVFCLPTEEEWEYACRAGSTGKYGLLADGREGTLDEMGWYDDNSDYKTHPVGQKKPNAWGLYDMHGNVLEWTASADGSSRIFRGGGFYISASGCESDDRLWSDPDGRYGSLGFRLVASRTVY